MSTTEEPTNEDQSLEYLLGFKKAKRMLYQSVYTGDTNGILLYSPYDFYRLSVIKSEDFYTKYLTVMKRLAVYPEEFNRFEMEPFSIKWQVFVTFMTIEEDGLASLTEKTINHTLETLKVTTIEDPHPQTQQTLEEISKEMWEHSKLPKKPRKKKD